MAKLQKSKTDAENGRKSAEKPLGSSPVENSSQAPESMTGAKDDTADAKPKMETLKKMSLVEAATFVKERLEKVEKSLGNTSYKCSVIFNWSSNGAGQAINIPNASLDNLIKVGGRLEAFRAGCLLAGIDTKTATISGHTLEEWEMDVRTRANYLKALETKAALKAVQEKINSLLSKKERRTLEADTVIDTLLSI